MTFEQALRELARQETGPRRAEPRHAHTGMWAASALRELISAGKLAPGTKLSEAALSDVLHVSRNTLREAFSALGAERIVTRIPNRGVYVAEPTSEDIREIYRVRRYLEPAALMWSPSADDDGGTDNVDDGATGHDESDTADDGGSSGGADDTADTLHTIIARARQARDTGSVPQMAGANQDFHCAVVARTGSRRLNDLMSQVLAEMRLVFHTMSADPEFHAPYVEDNARMLQLLDGGKRADAADLMADYLDRAEAQLLAAMANRAA